MTETPSTPLGSYGTTRHRRASVSYGEVERAATALLKAGKRPTIDAIREAVRGGAPDTITDALNRFWKDLGARIEGDPASLSRLPAEVADVAENLWRRALSLAADAAAQRAGADRENLEFFKRENELKAHSLSLKEKELDALLRAREKTIQELETHLRTTMGMLLQKEETIRALEARMGDLQAQVEHHGRRLSTVVTRAVRKHRMSAPKGRSRPAARLRTKPAKRRRQVAALDKRPKSKRRSKR